ncbi:tyrosine-protein phosphatase non-receptor type 5 isoform X2 [Corythoichthys intestinalis]|uniref:tyrosine-protein phosphatase non-receptor type 5 isoform X2 n=1 Tax=Corythoichthys intestinalis TaxID=161448 RepID=UPI0025A629B3|nr:tyrosine-protein phosphatase non-receptor type 5 isoform X2 [Corythoichthys intestinalis]
MRSAAGRLLLLLMLCRPTRSQSSSGQAEPRAADSSDSDPGWEDGVPNRLRRQRFGHPDGEVRVEHAAVAARHLVTVQFRGGAAAALGVPVGLVHINALDEEKNGVEIFVSSERADASEPWPARDVVRSLNVGVLRRRLARFGITEVSVQKNVLQEAPQQHAWGQEAWYTTVLFLAILIMAIVSLTLLFGPKTTSSGRLKATPPPFAAKVTCAHVSRDESAATLTSVTAAALPPPRLASPPEADPASSAAVEPVTSEPRPRPSPFRMKTPTGLQERRGSNVSLVLDVSGAVAVTPPREEAAGEYLTAARRPLAPQQLRRAVRDARALHDEFSEIPMNFTDAKHVDVPDHGSKNRYKTILPSESASRSEGLAPDVPRSARLLVDPGSRVVLRTGRKDDPLGSYINANYIRGYRGDEKAFIATQGPMANTVDDFWLMAWQEAAPAIVMITKLKEKSEKCVLYWPEKRGVFGRVEVEVEAARECQHYTARGVTLKRGDTRRTLRHFWFTAWPDHKTPSATVPLLRLMEDVEAARRAAPRAGPVIVHCSAGIGRTGCFIAASVGARQLAAEGAVDVLAITCQMRLDRGGMIQTAEQYEFVHHALSALAVGI